MTNDIRGFRCCCRQVPIDVCTTQIPCRHHATCTPADTQFMCSCSPGWRGERCDMPCVRGVWCNGMYDEGNTDMPIGSSVGFTDDGMSTGFNPGNTNGMSTGFNPGNTNGMSTGFNPGNTNGMFTGTDVNTDFTDGMFPSSSAGFTNRMPTGGFGNTNGFATTRDPGNNFTDGN